MFLEKLSDVEILKLMENGLNFVFDNDDTKEIMERAKYSKIKVAEDVIAELQFARSRYHVVQNLYLDDFNMQITCALLPVEEKINKDYRKSMYRKFGKEYLDALDKYAKAPIEEEYNKRINEHTKMIEEIKGTDREM